MAIRKWLWPKLETTEDAERELRNAAGWFLVFVVMELVGASIAFVADAMTSEDVFSQIIFAAITLFLAHLLHSKRSRTAALLLGCRPLYFLVNRLIHPGAALASSSLVAFNSILVAIVVLFTIRGIRAAFGFHRSVESRVVWKRLLLLAAAVPAYAAVFFFAAVISTFAMHEIGWFPILDPDLMVAKPTLIAIPVFIALAIARKLPGIRRVGPVVKYDGARCRVPDEQPATEGLTEGDVRDGRARSYFLRHWRGELPLARSFWINDLIVYFAISLGGWVLYEEGVIDSFRLLATVIALAAIVQIAAFVWMLVGVWRSSGRILLAMKRWFWPWMARAVLMCQVGVLAHFLSNFGPMALIALGLDPFNQYTLTRTGSQEILIQGLFGANLPGDVADLLDRAPEITWIRLESGGGRIGPARELATIIIDHGLQIRVWYECSSACVLPFMAADVRALSPKASIGLHRYSSEDGFQFYVSEEMERDRQFLIKRGVPESFLDKAFSTPPDDMWYPSFEELVEAGVVTHVMEDGETRPVRPE